MENQFNVGNQNTQQIGQNPVNQISPPAPQRKIKFSFRFFKYLNIFEKTGYIISFVIGLVLSVNFIIAAINSLRSGKADFGGGDLIILSIVLLPFLIANNIRLKGLKRIPQHERTNVEIEQLKEAETSSHQLSSTVKQFAIIGSIIVVISLLIFLAVYFLILNRGPHKISDYSAPVNPCEPPREVKVLYTEPDQFHDMEPNGSIKAVFNENIDETTLNKDNVKVCTKLRGIGSKLEDIPCIDVATKGIEPRLEYSKENRELLVSLLTGKEWGLSDTFYTRYVDLTISPSVKSICGLNLQNGYHVAIPIKSSGGQFLDTSENMVTPVQTSPSPQKYETLIIENLSIKDEGDQHVARGFVKNKSNQAFQPVYVNWVLLDSNNSPVASAKHMVNQLGGGLVNPGREIPFEVMIGSSVVYATYTIEVYVQ